MTFRSQLMIGLLVTLGLPITSFGADVTSTKAIPARVYSQTEVKYIRGINCDTFTGSEQTRCLDIKEQALSQSATGTGDMFPPPIRSQTGEYTRTQPIPSHMATGAMMGSDMRHPDNNGIILAISQLTPTDHESLMKMIGEYLISKGIDITKYAEKREEIKEIRKDTHETLKDTRNKVQEATKAKREEMRKKVRSIRQSSESDTTL